MVNANDYLLKVSLFVQTVICELSPILIHISLRICRRQCIVPETMNKTIRTRLIGIETITACKLRPISCANITIVVFCPV